MKLDKKLKKVEKRKDGEMEVLKLEYKRELEVAAVRNQSLKSQVKQLKEANSRLEMAKMINEETHRAKTAQIEQEVLKSLSKISDVKA